MAEKTGGRIVKRWVAECGFGGFALDRAPSTSIKGHCEFNDRKAPQTHLTSKSAVRESIEHAKEAGHVGARQVSVKRTYTPRTIASEEVVQ